MYGLVVTSVLGVTLNILFASREIKLPFFLFVKPILMQMGITLFSVILTLLITKNLDQLNIIMLIVKGSIFTFMYVLFNYFIKTSSYTYFNEQVIPLIKKRKKKKN